MGGLEAVVAAAERCCCHARACYRAVRPVARHPEKMAEVAAAQDTYRDIADRQESKASATERMERRD